MSSPRRIGEKGKHYKIILLTDYVEIFWIIVAKCADDLDVPPALRQRVTEKRQEILAELKRKISLAADLNQRHLEAHKRLEEMHQHASKAHEMARAAAKEAADLEMDAIKAANEVRGLHLALGSVTIGMFRIIHLSIRCTK